MGDVEGFSRRTKGLSELAFQEAYGSPQLDDLEVGEHGKFSLSNNIYN
jgi:hypothetical protein